MYAFLMNTNVLHSQEQSKHISTVVWAENFFTHFNFMFPILSRPQFHYQLEHKEVNPMLKLAVFLLGCRLSNQQQDVQQEKALYQQFNDLFASASHDDSMKADLSTVQVIVQIEQHVLSYIKFTHATWNRPQPSCAGIHT